MSADDLPGFNVAARRDGDVTAFGAPIDLCGEEGWGMAAKYLVWGRDLDIFNTLDAAVDLAVTAEDNDDLWIDRIEVIGDGARIIDGAELRALMQPALQARYAQWDRQAADRPFVGNVNVDGVALRSFYGDNGLTEAEAFAAELRPMLGDRVQVVPAKRR